MKKKVKSSSRNIDQILKLDKKQFNEEIKELRKVDRDEKEVIHLEKEQIKELEDLKKLDQKIKNEIGEHPLRKITYKDIGKSMIGAFVGIVSHFTVLEGVDFAENISFGKANSFYLISLLVGFIMLYYTGFRKVKDARLFAILPLRLFLVYAVMIIAILLTLLVFGSGHIEQELVYSQVAVLSLPAMIGACAADLIGGE